MLVRDAPVVPARPDAAGRRAHVERTKDRQPDLSRDGPRRRQAQRRHGYKLGVGIVTVRVAFGILTVVRLTNYQSTLDVLERWTGGKAQTARESGTLLSPAAVTFSALT